MRVKTEMNKCLRCGRHVWVESVRCPWCNKPVTSRRYRLIQKWIDIIIIVVSLTGLGAIMATLIGRA